MPHRRFDGDAVVKRTMQLRSIISGVFLSWMAVVSAQVSLPAPIPTFHVRQLPMTGVRWAGPIGSLAVNPAHATEILAASRSGGLFRSDGGGSWTHVDSLTPNDLSNVLWVPTFGVDTVFVTTRDDFRSEARGLNTSGVWRSLDRGATWRQVLRLKSGPLPTGANCDTRPMAYGLSADPVGVGTIGSRLFVATKCGIWRSTGTGSSFVRWAGTATSPDHP